MKIKIPKNENYCATVVRIKNIVPLINCDNVIATIIMENQVITSKETKIDDIGLFFPVETQLSDKFLKANNLYKHAEKNENQEKKGYFEDNGRVRCVKFRSHASEGLFIPISCLTFIYPPNKQGGYGGVWLSDFFKIGEMFDELEGIPICQKYIITKNVSGLPGNKKQEKPIESKLIDNQFKFHIDTPKLYAYLDRIHSDDLVSLSYKVHGVSFIISKILCKKSLKWYEKVLKKLNVNIITTQYEGVYSSRNSIRNEGLGKIPSFHSEDIWRIAYEELQDFLSEGMTIYGEAAGFLPGGGALQKGFDYGCEPNKHKLFIYRITYTNPLGKVFEFSAKQVQDFCFKNGLLVVPQLYYGYAKDFTEHVDLMFAETTFGSKELICTLKKEFDTSDFIHRVKELYTEKDCFMCSEKVPEEGCVIRIENLGLEVYKCKSTRFLEWETKKLDKGESDIESEN